MPNDPSGSQWRKWDLHVHTPDSLEHRYTGANTDLMWEQFLNELESLPAEFKVIGVNDYIFVGGYRRLKAAKDQGRLPNIDLLLPVIELRLDKFGGSTSHLSKVNFHVIFSDEVDADLIEKQFVNGLWAKYELTPSYHEFKQTWKALPTRQSIEDLGKLIIESVPAEKRADFGSALMEGFGNVTFTREVIEEALDKPYFKAKYLLAVGKTEWADMKWNDHSIAEKKNVINSVELVFTAAASPEAYERSRKKLTDEQVNHHLLDCSDAHSFAGTADKDRMGNCFTWIKADTTFLGLRHALVEFDDRVYVGEEPAKLKQVRQNKTQYIRAVAFQKAVGSKLEEHWFSGQVPLNHGLVAIIGNKGSGKSALADTLGLLGNSRQQQSFSFLNLARFCDPKQNKARDFCNETDDKEETDFDRELKKIIFSHVPEADHLGHDSLDALLTYKTSESFELIEALRSELEKINREIADCEDKLAPEYREQIQNSLQAKLTELAANEGIKPDPVEPPPSDPLAEEQTAALVATLNEKKDARKGLLGKIQESATRRNEENRLIAVADKLSARISNFRRAFESIKKETAAEFADLGLDLDSTMQLTINVASLGEKRATLAASKANLDKLLDTSAEGSLPSQVRVAEAEIADLQSKLDGPGQRYQAYLHELEEWTQKQAAITGDEVTPGTIIYFKNILDEIELIPTQLEKHVERRREKTHEIFNRISELADTYRELYKAVKDFIQTHPVAKDKLQLNFEVSIEDMGFENKFFDFVSHGVTGSFMGVDEGKKALRTILKKVNFNDWSHVNQFCNDIVDHLKFDRRELDDDVPVRLASTLRKGYRVLDVYDYVFSLGYLQPKYTLKLGDKELTQLSPGEKGSLLLIFYLLVDRGKMPLVIDQPEENLDNQTMYNLLVPCLKDAKHKRQVIIVTHNPNLAVVSDAEQVIHAELDKANKNLLTYTSGALENPQINQKVLDVLEGTKPAFNNRAQKYQVGML